MDICVYSTRIIYRRRSRAAYVQQYICHMSCSFLFLLHHKMNRLIKYFLLWMENGKITSAKKRRNNHKQSQMKKILYMKCVIVLVYVCWSKMLTVILPYDFWFVWVCCRHRARSKFNLIFRSRYVLWWCCCYCFCNETVIILFFLCHCCLFSFFLWLLNENADAKALTYVRYYRLVFMVSLMVN